MHLIFIKKSENESYDTLDLEFKSSAVTLTEVLEDIEMFLRACGYHVPMNSLIIEKGEE